MKKILLVGMVAALLAGCVPETQALENAHAAAQHAQAAHIADPLREASFSANGIKATLNNGFTQATINGKKASVKRSNANFYEIKGAGYILSISVDADGVTDASWNKTHGRDHGILNVVQSSPKAF